MSNGTTSAWIAASAALAAVFLTQFLAENYRRFKDGSALAAGIAGELSSYKGGPEILQDSLMEWIKASKGGWQAALNFRPFDRPTDMFFDQAVGKLGQLGPSLVEHTVYVYSNLRAFRMGLELITKVHGDMSPDEFQARCVLCLESVERARKRAEFLLPLLRKRADQRFFARTAKVPSPPDSVA